MKILFLAFVLALPHFAGAQPAPPRGAWGVPWTRPPAIVVVSRSDDAKPGELTRLLQMYPGERRP